LESAVPIRFEDFLIGRACPLLVVVMWHADPFSQFTTVHPRYDVYHPTN